MKNTFNKNAFASVKASNEVEGLFMNKYQEDLIIKNIKGEISKEELIKGIMEAHRK
ncbi:MAG TPA: antitoxin VbhA family protein [Metabacillus sp.]|nr:antitoxin VbhA family protein [Metabacillus sp.]